jgi:diguanylate cyclase (GGDEF)-like protein/PAS domain S-box-containing protein
MSNYNQANYAEQKDSQLMERMINRSISQSHQNLLSLLDPVNDCIFGLDAKNRILFANSQAFGLFANSNSQTIIGSTIDSLLHLKLIDGVSNNEENLITKIISQRNTTASQKAVLCVKQAHNNQNTPDQRICFWLKTDILSDCPTLTLFGFQQLSPDPNELDELKVHIERYHSLVSTTNAVLWELDLKSKSFTFVSPQAAIAFGYPIENWYKPGFWYDSMHPADRDWVNTRCETLCLELDSYLLEYRMLSATGDVLFVKDFINVIKDQSGPIALRGVFVDCTKEKSLEQEVRLNSAVFNTAEAVAITDKHANFIKVNQAFMQITGYSEDEVIGKTPRLLQSGVQDENFYHHFWSELKAFGRWQGEIWNKRKNGEVYPEWLTVTSVVGDGDDVENYVAVFSDISQRKQDEEKIKYQANYDQLTGLPNRGLLNERLSQHIKESKSNRLFGALLLLDLDNFRMLNDSLGHHRGDELLKLVASRLQLNASSCDFVARTGGDEYAIIVPAIGACFNDAKIASMAFAEDLLHLFVDHFYIAKQAVHFSVSIGLSIFPSDEESSLDIMRQADTAMYRAKAAGKNQVRSYSSEMYEEVERRLSVYNELKVAMQKNQLELHYQPVFDAQMNIVSAEALCRWNHEEQGYISPSEFIPIAEQTGLIIELSSWVMETALHHLKKWSDNKLNLQKLAINVSSQRFSHPDFLSEISYLIDKTGVDPHLIELEITEEVMIEGLHLCINVFKTLQQLGVSIAVDDFGTGYSSLSYLSKLPINKLKIDRAFVCELPSNGSDAVIVDTIFSMANHLGFSVTAEGIETPEQLDFLQGRMCHFYQGFLLGKPMPEKEFMALLQQQTIKPFPPIG